MAAGILLTDLELDPVSMRYFLQAGWVIGVA
jgi:hypothetical protein